MSRLRVLGLPCNPDRRAASSSSQAPASPVLTDAAARWATHRARYAMSAGPRYWRGPSGVQCGLDHRGAPLNVVAAEDPSAVEVCLGHHDNHVVLLRVC